MDDSKGDERGAQQSNRRAIKASSQQKYQHYCPEIGQHRQQAGENGEVVIVVKWLGRYRCGHVGDDLNDIERQATVGKRAMHARAGIDGARVQGALSGIEQVLKIRRPREGNAILEDDSDVALIRMKVMCLIPIKSIQTKACPDHQKQS